MRRASTVQSVSRFHRRASVDRWFAGQAASLQLGLQMGQGRRRVAVALPLCEAPGKGHDEAQRLGQTASLHFTSPLGFELQMPGRVTCKPFTLRARARSATGRGCG